MKSILIAGMLLLPILSLAQNSRGRVMDENGNPLHGATVRALRNGETVLTDRKGEFILNLAIAGDSLQITAVGFQTLRLPASLNQMKEIVLQPLSKTLAEVTINTGYQELPKERVTGSFYKIDNTLFNQKVSTDIISRLNGITSSALFDKRSNPPVIQIRGLSTLTAGIASPLIILDNFPYTGDISNINPNEVESITVLKDAAATSIWGAKAGNGVIVITTRRATFNQPLKINVNTSYSYNKKTDLFSADQISTSDFIDIEKYLFSKGFYDASFNSTSRPGITPVVEILNRLRNNQVTAAVANAQIDSFRTLDYRNDFMNYLEKNIVKRQVTIDLSGGGKDMNYLFSGGYDNNQPGWLGYNSQRVTFHYQNDIKINPKWTVQTAAFFSQSHNDYAVNSGEGSYTARTVRPYQYLQLKDRYGNNAALDINYRKIFTDTAGAGKLLNWKWTPLDEYALNSTKNVVTDFIGRVNSSYRVNKIFSLDLKYQYEKTATDIKVYHDPNSFFMRDLVNQFTQINNGVVKYIIPKGGILDFTHTNTVSNSVRGQINAKKSWDGGRHDLSAIAGGEVQEARMVWNSFRTYGYNDNVLTYSNVDFANAYPSYNNIKGQQFIPGFNTLKATINRFVSIYGNAAYSFLNRYSISASARRDASNIFGVKTNQKSVPLWSAGGKWKISDEKFYHSNLFPQLALRVTEGYSGNYSPTGKAVATIRYSGPSSSTINIPFVSIATPPNPELRWEKVYMLNTGIDFSMKNNRIVGSVEYYSKVSNDLLNSTTLDPTTGNSFLTKNSAQMKGNGIDLVLNSLNWDTKLKWKTSLLFNYVKYKVTKTYQDRDLNGFVSSGVGILDVVGYSPYLIVSYKWAGLDPLTGDPMGYKDGQPTKNYSAIGTNPLVQQVITGSALPTFFGSVRNSFSWKNISVAVNITYRLGYYFRRPSLNYGSLFSYMMSQKEWENRWQKPGDEKTTNVPSMIYPAVSLRDGFYNNSEINVEKGDHIRLEDVYLDYTWQRGRPGINSVQFYTYLDNINWLLWKANKKGLDPDFLYGVRPSPGITFGARINFK